MYLRGNFRSCAAVGALHVRKLLFRQDFVRYRFALLISCAVVSYVIANEVKQSVVLMDRLPRYARNDGIF